MFQLVVAQLKEYAKYKRVTLAPNLKKAEIIDLLEVSETREDFHLRLLTSGGDVYSDTGGARIRAIGGDHLRHAETFGVTTVCCLYSRLQSLYHRTFTIMTRFVMVDSGLFGSRVIVLQRSLASSRVQGVLSSRKDV